MKRVTIMAHVDPDICRGCRVCEKVCPVYAIHVTHRKAAVEEPDCRGCANCADRCPFHAITMVKREEPFTVGVDVSRFDAAKILALCEKAHFLPQQVFVLLRRRPGGGSGRCHSGWSGHAGGNLVPHRNPYRLYHRVHPAHSTSAGGRRHPAQTQPGRLAMVWRDGHRLDHAGEGQAEICQPRLLF